MKQNELIHQLSSEELRKNLVFSQLTFLVIAIILSMFLFENFTDWKLYFEWNFNDIFYCGVLAGLLIVAIDFILMRIFPASAFDDGGINEKVFNNQSIFQIFLIALLVAISEELLFRGVIQTTFGYVFASLLFAVIHFRYLKKIVLFVSVVCISLFIGYIFILTENLIVTIVIHFIVDFLLGLYIRFKK